jgi:L-rhamnose mutarotase
MTKIENNKYAWTWTIKEECLEEYTKMHLNPWPEILKAHPAAGIRNYSIYLNGNQGFYEFECDDITAAFHVLDTNPDCQRWNAITSTMVKGSFDFGAAVPIQFLKQVFYLK